MKRKITRPDGTVEEVEGTAEELAELERAGKKSQKKESRQPSRRVLTDEIQRLTEENKKLQEKLDAANNDAFKKLIEKIQTQPSQLPPYWPPYVPEISPWIEPPYIEPRRLIDDRDTKRVPLQPTITFTVGDGCRFDGQRFVESMTQAMENSRKSETIS